MPHIKLEQVLSQRLDELNANGLSKGKEKVISRIKPGDEPEQGSKGPRYRIAGFGGREFIRMNSNSYLGMSLRPEVIRAEEAAAKRFGTGPGAVRFISGTHQPHIDLENRLARFHNREAGMVFSSAYATVVGIISSLIDAETVVISDELNHNCIINAVRMSRPKTKVIYKHLDMDDLEGTLKKIAGKGHRALIITDGIFSMRGDHAPLDLITHISERYDDAFQEGVITIVDDSHGVGAFGKTGRGTEEYTNARGVDLLIATLGKAIGVNGGYVTGSSTIIRYLRETAPFYIYSNPITPAEAAAAIKAVEIIDSKTGAALLKNLRKLTRRFEIGLINMGFEIIQGEHPVVPVMIRETRKTSRLVQYLTDNGILATGLNFPVVPKGDEEIRFQVSADHTESDIDYVLEVMGRFSEERSLN